MFVKRCSLLVAFAMLLTVNSQAAGIRLNEPVVVNRNGFQKIQLNRDVQEALKKADKHFRIFEKNNFHRDVLASYPMIDKQLPQAVKADFNGDGIQDIVVMGRSVNSEVAIYGVLSTPSGYVANLAFKWTKKDIKGWAGSRRILKGGNIRRWPYKLWLAPDGQIQFLNAQHRLNLHEGKPHVKYSSGTGGSTEGVFRITQNKFELIDTNRIDIENEDSITRGTQSGP